MPFLNKISQDENGDKSLRIDEEEMVISRYNGESNKERKYHRHKDSYKRNKNNEIHGQSLRKISMVIFLNDNIDEVQSSPTKHNGMLRLYPNGETIDGVVDISPRMGRAVMFKSEEMMH